MLGGESSCTGALRCPLELPTTYGGRGDAEPGCEITITASIVSGSGIALISSRMPVAPVAEPLTDASTKVRSCWRSPRARASSISTPVAEALDAAAGAREASRAAATTIVLEPSPGRVSTTLRSATSCPSYSAP